MLKFGTVLNTGYNCSCKNEVLDFNSLVPNFLGFKAHISEDSVHNTLLGGFRYDVGYFNFSNSLKHLSKLVVCGMFWDTSDEDFLID